MNFNSILLLTAKGMCSNVLPWPRNTTVTISNDSPTHGRISALLLLILVGLIAPCVGYFTSRDYQRRYIWLAESNCYRLVLVKGKRKYEPGRHVNQHLDVQRCTVDRFGASLAHMETVGLGNPPASSYSNHVKIDGDIRMLRV